MKSYICRLLPCLLVSCTTFSPQVADPPAEQAPELRTSAKPAPKSLAPNTAKIDSRHFLKEAAKCLDAGDEAAALPLLESYVAANPDHATIRVHLAELLLRLKKPVEAKRHLERYVADAQEQGEPIDQHLVHAETRLVEIAGLQGDRYAERLHRGIGLCILAQRVAKSDDADDDFVEKTLFQSIGELEKAAKECPDEPRPHWYLFLAWSALGQRLPAITHLNRARNRSATGGLTPIEAREMALAE